MTVSARAMVVAGAAAASVCASSASAIPRVGKPAPPFRLTTFDGQQVSLEELKGQVVVLNYWATWCGPCKRELPLLDSFYRKANARGLRVFAVATEDAVPPSQLKPLQAGLAIPMAKRMHGAYDTLDAVPTNFVIDRAGVVRYAKAGAWTLDDLNSVVIPLLKEQAPAEGEDQARRRSG